MPTTKELEARAIIENPGTPNNRRVGRPRDEVFVAAVRKMVPLGLLPREIAELTGKTRERVRQVIVSEGLLAEHRRVREALRAKQVAEREAERAASRKRCSVCGEPMAGTRNPDGTPSFCTRTKPCEAARANYVYHTNPRVRIKRAWNAMQPGVKRAKYAAQRRYRQRLDALGIARVSDLEKPVEVVPVDGRLYPALVVD